MGVVGDEGGWLFVGLGGVSTCLSSESCHLPSLAARWRRRRCCGANQHRRGAFEDSDPLMAKVDHHHFNLHEPVPMSN